MSESVVTPEQLESKLAEALAPDFMQATDCSDGCGQKYEITVVSSKFAGMALLAQHRLVNKAIEEERKHIHAITLKTMTPEVWATKQQS